jgi:hypothetical protein
VGEIPCHVTVRYMEMSSQLRVAVDWKPDYHSGRVIEGKGSSDLSRPTNV